MLELYTFNLSHFSEKARWALDYEGISYEERILLPGPHQLVTRRIAPRTACRCLNTMANTCSGRERSLTTLLIASAAPS